MAGPAATSRNLLNSTKAGKARTASTSSAPRGSTIQPLHGVILELQRTAGNAAVADLLTGKAAEVPWIATTLYRAPEAASAVAAPTEKGMESVLLEKVPGGGKRPLDLAALVRPGADGAGGAVSVLLHLHGISIFEGHRYEQMIHKGIVPPEFHMESQLEAVAAANPKQRLIAILPAGNTVPAGQTKSGKTSYTVDFGGFDTDRLADQAVTRLVGMGRLPAGSTAGGVIVSAHSGGGFEAKHAAGGKKVVGMLAFESIHGDADAYRTLLLAHLDADLGELKDIARRPGLSGDKLFQAQKEYLLERGFRFVGFAGSNPGYRETFHQLDLAIHGPGGWVSKHDEALQQAGGAHSSEVKAMLEANYQFHIEKTGDHFKVMQGNLAKAMGGPMPATPSAPVVRAEKPGAAKAAAAPAATPAAPPAKKAKPKRKPRSGPYPIPEGAFRSDQLPAYGGAETTAFRKAVYDKQQQISLAQDEERAANGEPTRFSMGIPDNQLGKVDGKPIHKAATADANALLSEAHAALDAAKAKGDPLALGCASIGVNNAYRSPETDFDAWQNSFATHYKNTADERKAQVGGPLGPAAVNVLAWELVNFKAIPGFSNHSQGMAMDFQTVQNGKKLGPSSAQKKLWRNSWLYKWLRVNGPQQNFTQLKSEEWHWDHHGGGGAAAPPKASTASTPPAATPVATPAAPVPAVKPAAPATSTKPAAAPSAAAAVSPQVGVSISFGPNARRDAVAASSIEILTDILRAAGLRKATITSTARNAEDQARAMYQNLVTAGVEAQRKLYAAPGNNVIDTFEELTEAGKAPQEVQDGMRDRILQIGPSKVSRHCGDFRVLNVFDVGPYSLGGPKARKAFAEAAQAEVGKRISKFIPWPKDPGDHIEIKIGSPPAAAAPPKPAKLMAPATAPATAPAHATGTASTTVPEPARPIAPAAAAVTASVNAKWSGAAEQKDFLERVLKAHLAKSTAAAAGKVLPDLSGDELGTVAGTDVQMKKEAAAAAGALIAAANDDLKASEDPDAKLTAKISATSGYRGRSKQEQLWRGYFPHHYEKTAKQRAKQPGGEHGDAAVTFMRDYVSPKIAAPGFSNHQAGVAIDFWQVRSKGHEIHNSTDDAEISKWKDSWFFKWLNANGLSHNFGPYYKEPWHWEFGSKGR